MKLSDIRVDAKAIEAGDWVDINPLQFPGMDGVRLKVRGAGNADYRRLQSKLFRALPVSDDPVKQEEAGAAITTELLLRTVLIGWDGIFEEDGVTPLPYSVELAERLLADPEMRVLRDAVAFAGALIATRKKQTRDEAVKN